MLKKLLLESQFGTVEKLLKPDTPPSFKNALKIAIDKILSINPTIVQDFQLNGTTIADEFFTLDLPFDYILYKLEDTRQSELTSEQLNLYDNIENKFATQMSLINDSFQKLRAFNQIVKSIIGNDNADTFVKILNLPRIKGDANELNHLTDLFKIINSKGGVNQNFSKKLDIFINNMLQLHIKWFNTPYRNQETVKPNIPIGTRILNYFDLFTILTEYINNSDSLNMFALFSKLNLHNTNFINYLSQDFQNNLWDIFLKEDDGLSLDTQQKSMHSNSSIGTFAGYQGGFIEYCVDNNYWIPMNFEEPNVKIFLINTYEGTAMACNILPYETDFTSNKSTTQFSDSVKLNPHFFVNGSTDKNKNKKLRGTTEWCIKSFNKWYEYSSKYWQNSFLFILDNNLSYNDPNGAILTGLVTTTDEYDEESVSMSDEDFMNADDDYVYHHFKQRDYSDSLFEVLSFLNKDNLSQYFSKNFQLKTSNIDKINLLSKNLDQEIYEANLIQVLGFEVTSNEKTKVDVNSRIFNNQLFKLPNLNNIAKESDAFTQFFLNLTQIIINILTKDTKIHFLKTENNIVSAIEFFNFFELFNNPGINDALSNVVDEYINNNLTTIKKTLLNDKSLEQLSIEKVSNNLLLFQKSPVNFNFKFDINPKDLQVFNHNLIENKINEIKQLYIDRCISEFNSLTDDSIFNIIRELFYKDAYENDNNQVSQFFKDPNNIKKFINTFFKVMQPLIVKKVNENFNSDYQELMNEYLKSIDQKIVDKINEKLNSLSSVKELKISQELKLLNVIISKKFLTNKNIRKTSSRFGEKHIPIFLLFNDFLSFPRDVNNYSQIKNTGILPMLNYIKNTQFYVSDDFLNANFNEDDKRIILQNFELLQNNFYKSIRTFNIDDLIEKISNEDEEKQYNIHTFMFLLSHFFKLDSAWQTAVLNQPLLTDNFSILIRDFSNIFLNLNGKIDFKNYSIFNRVKDPNALKEIFIDTYKVIINKQGGYNKNDITKLLSYKIFNEQYKDVVSVTNNSVYSTYINGNPSIINYLNYLYSNDLNIQSSFEDFILTKLNEFQNNPMDIFTISFISLLGLALIFTVSFKTKVLNQTVANVLYNIIRQIEQEKITNHSLDLSIFYEQISTIFMFFHILQNAEQIDFVDIKKSIQNLLNKNYSANADRLLQDFKKEIEMSGYIKNVEMQNESINYIKRNQKIIISEKDLRKLLLKLL